MFYVKRGAKLHNSFNYEHNDSVFCTILILLFIKWIKIQQMIYYRFSFLALLIRVSNFICNYCIRFKWLDFVKYYSSLF